MAKGETEIKVSTRISVPKETARFALNLVETYLNENSQDYIIHNIRMDGSHAYSFASDGDYPEKSRKDDKNE